MNITPESVSEDVINQAADLLDISPSIIKDKKPEFGLVPGVCDGCGKKMDFFDFVKTANDTGLHSKKFMIDFFKSPNAMEKSLDSNITCSDCGKSHSVSIAYKYGGPHTCGGSS
ncbi:TPA: hypothetical protein I8546_004891 [Raoultella ornithinolytica]|nr:hypothetical protein [Raoultella ornithinolytica]